MTIKTTRHRPCQERNCPALARPGHAYCPAHDAQRFPLTQSAAEQAARPPESTPTQDRLWG